MITIVLLPAVAGIYLITNTLTGEQYVGQSANMAGRQMDHLAALIRGSHTALVMQAAFKAAGLSRFTFAVLEELPGADSRTLLSRERDWIEELEPKYNNTGQPGRYRQLPSSLEAIAASKYVPPIPSR